LAACRWKRSFSLSSVCGVGDCSSGAVAASQSVGAPFEFRRFRAPFEAQSVSEGEASVFRAVGDEKNCLRSLKEGFVAVAAEAAFGPGSGGGMRWDFFLPMMQVDQLVVLKKGFLFVSSVCLLVRSRLSSFRHIHAFG
jgi:hypothetical protein